MKGRKGKEISLQKKATRKGTDAIRSIHLKKGRRKGKGQKLKAKHT